MMDYAFYAKTPAIRNTTTGEILFAPRGANVVKMPPADDDTLYTWKSGDELETIAFEQWGTSRLWWLICDINGIIDPMLISAGTVLQLPTRARVEMELIARS